MKNYRLLILVVGLCLFYSPGYCQEKSEKEIGWEDIEDVGDGQEPEQEPVQAPEAPKRAAPEAKPQSPVVEPSKDAIQDTKPVVPQTSEPKIAPKATPKPAKKEIPPAKQRRNKTEGKWKRIDKITDSDPAANRDLFITNPGRQ